MTVMVEVSSVKHQNNIKIKLVKGNGCSLGNIDDRDCVSKEGG